MRPREAPVILHCILKLFYFAIIRHYLVLGLDQAVFPIFLLFYNSLNSLELVNNTFENSSEKGLLTKERKRKLFHCCLRYSKIN